ncbi:MAG: inositol monophosphatase family protein [Promethearchaeota archaeon]
MSHYNKELFIAIDLVKKASEIVEWFKKSGFKSYRKGDNSPTTLADFASQIFIVSKLKEEFPDDQIFAEESESNFIQQKEKNIIKKCYRELRFDNITDLKTTLNYKGNPSNRKWTIDPIDGTIGFQKGLLFAIGISLLVDSETEISAISVPNYNENGLAIFSAEFGQGAKASYGEKPFVPISVSRQNDVKKARMCHSLHYDMPWVIQFAKKIGIKASNIISLDSMAKFCMVADGSVDLYIKPIIGYKAYSWDFSPGDLLVREAGGKVTDLDEERLKFKNEKCILRAPGIISTNNILHDEVSDFIRNNFFSIEV